MKLSVLMPAYNAMTNYPEGMFHDVIFKTLYQQDLRRNFEVELCIIDDCSTDDTRSFVEGLRNQMRDRIRLGWVNENGGVARALNLAAAMASGDYYIVQSVRSWYEQESLYLMAKHLEDHPDIGFTYGVTKYHGALQHRHVPPPFQRESFRTGFHSLFGYMYRSSAITEHKCRYESYFFREGKHIDISDYDFVMQLIFNLGWNGEALPWLDALQYHYSGSGQMTNLVHKYQREIDEVFRSKWHA